jgi:hypothetical protein
MCHFNAARGYILLDRAGFLKDQKIQDEPHVESIYICLSAKIKKVSRHSIASCHWHCRKNNHVASTGRLASLLVVTKETFVDDHASRAVQLTEQHAYRGSPSEHVE